MALDPATVANLLADSSTRIAALDALEAHGGPHPTPLAVAAAPALTDVLCLDAAEVDHVLFQRVGLLRARLLADAPPDDVPAIYGAMVGGGRFAKSLNAPSNVIARMFTKPVGELNSTDALSYACAGEATSPTRDVRGWTVCIAAAGFTGVMDWLGPFLASEPIVSK